MTTPDASSGTTVALHVMESNERERTSYFAKTSTDEETSPVGEPLSKRRNEAQVDSTQEGSDGQKGTRKSVRFSEDSSSGEGQKLLQGGDSKHDLDYSKAPFQKADTDSVSLYESAPQTRGRSHSVQKQRSKRSQTPFRPRKDDVLGPDDNDDGIDNTGSRSDELLSSKCDHTSQTTETRCTLSSEPNTNDMHASESMVPSCQIIDGASEDSKSASRCGEDLQIEVKSPNSGIRPCVSADVSTHSDKDGIPNFETACVGKSPVSTPVRFMEVSRDEYEEQAANVATAGTRPESTDKDLVDFAGAMSSQGRQRSKSGKPGRRSQTPFNPRRISCYDSDEDETEGVGCSHADVQKAAATTGPKVSEVETTTQAEALDERVSSSLRSRVTFAIDEQPDEETSAEFQSGMPLTSSLVRFSEPIDGSARRESSPAHLREASMETHVVAREDTSSSISPRGRQREATRRPGRRSQTPFNRRWISYSDNEDEGGKSTTSVNQSSYVSGPLDPSENDVTKSRETPADMRLSSKPRVTFATQVRSSDGTTTSPAASSVHFAAPAITLPIKQTGVVIYHKNAEENSETHLDTHSTQVPRGRQRTANRKPGRRSQTPFSCRPTNINTSDNEDIHETNVNQASIYTLRPSVLNTNSDPDRVSVDDETRQHIPAATKPLSTTLKVPELNDMQGSAQMCPIWGGNMDKKGNQTPCHHRKGYAVASDDANGDICQFSKDSDIGLVCRSISRVTVCSQASEEIRIFQKGTQTTPTYELATQTTLDGMQDSLEDSQGTTVGTTNSRTRNVLIGLAQWIGGMMGNCH